MGQPWLYTTTNSVLLVFLLQFTREPCRLFIKQWKCFQCFVSAVPMSNSCIQVDGAHTNGPQRSQCCSTADTSCCFIKGLQTSFRLQAMPWASRASEAKSLSKTVECSYCIPVAPVPSAPPPCRAAASAARCCRKGSDCALCPPGGGAEGSGSMTGTSHADPAGAPALAGSAGALGSLISPSSMKSCMDK